MASPIQIRANLKTFLKAETSFPAKVERSVIKTMMQKDGLPSDVSTDVVDEYRRKNWERVQKETERILDATCKGLSPGSAFWYFAKQFSLFAVALIPPLTAVFQYAATLWENPKANASSLALCGVSITLLVALICVAAVVMYTERKN